MFEPLKYDPEIYNKVVQNYSNGKTYQIKQFEWAYTEDHKCFKDFKKILDCPTLEDFNREIWDLFADFSKTRCHEIIWGAFGLKVQNPERPKQVFCDGLIFFLIREEFINCITNRSVSHFMSCLVHYGFENLIFITPE